MHLFIELINLCIHFIKSYIVNVLSITHVRISRSHKNSGLQIQNIFSYTFIPLLTTNLADTYSIPRPPADASGTGPCAWRRTQTARRCPWPPATPTRTPSTTTWTRATTRSSPSSSRPAEEEEALGCLLPDRLSLPLRLPRALEWWTYDGVSLLKHLR